MVEDVLSGVPFGVIEFDFVCSGSYRKQIGRFPQFAVSIPTVGFLLNYLTIFNSYFSLRVNVLPSSFSVYTVVFVSFWP